MTRETIPAKALAFLAAIALPGILYGQDAALGSWRGYWSRGGDTLHVTMAIQAGDAPTRYRVSFSADRLRVAGIPFNSAEREGCCVLRLTLRGDATTLVFEGTIKGDAIAGTFTEAGAAGTFALRREPAARSAIREEEVQFANGPVRLSGTLILPSTAPPHPAVVMMHGSGAEGRWANRFLARRFAASGVAALIFDKRGVGQSSGDWQVAGFEDLAADGARAVAMLRARSDIRPSGIGLFGHSQGATILPLVAVAAGDVAFVIASAGSAVPTDSAERFSLRHAVGFSTLPPDEAAKANDYVQEVVAVAYHGKPRARFDSLATAFATKPWYFAPPPPGSHYWAFSRRIAGYEPRRRWMQVRAPVLLLYGSNDQRVPVQPSIQVIRDALAAARRDPPTVCVYPGADHTERVRRPGDVWPRNADGYLEDMMAWVQTSRSDYMRSAILALALCSTAAAPVAAQQPSAPTRASDSAGVRRAALDYLEGFYEGDSAKIVRSVRPDARKVGYFTSQGSSTYQTDEMPFAAMIAYTNNFRKNGRTTPATAPREVEVGEVNDQTATAKVVAWWGIDYLQLARYNGKWMIVNVMWQSPPK